MKIINVSQEDGKVSLSMKQVDQRTGDPTGVKSEKRRKPADHVETAKIDISAIDVGSIVCARCNGVGHIAIDCRVQADLVLTNGESEAANYRKYDLVPMDDQLVDMLDRCVPFFLQLLFSSLPLSHYLSFFCSFQFCASFTPYYLLFSFYSCLSLFLFPSCSHFPHTRYPHPLYPP